MKSRTTFIIFISIIFISVCTVGCINQSETTVSPPVTVSQSSLPTDFPIAISQDGLGNVTHTITRNLSEIQSSHYRDIPVLLDLKNQTYCGYTSASDYPAYAEIALNDSRIQKILETGGVVKGMYVWGPPSFTKEDSHDPCALVSITLEINYGGTGVTALINNSTRTVVLPPEFS